jgi:hypothetical protein
MRTISSFFKEHNARKIMRFEKMIFIYERCKYCDCLTNENNCIGWSSLKRISEPSKFTCYKWNKSIIEGLV